MSKESLTDWYLERFDEIQGLEFQVEQKGSTTLVLSNKNSKFPSTVVLKISLTEGYLTIETPLKLDPETGILKSLLLTNKLRSHLAVKDINDSTVPLIRINRTLNDDLKLSKKEFHSCLSKFFRDYRAQLELLDEDQGSQPRENEKQSQSPKEGSIAEQKAKVGFEV